MRFQLHDHRVTTGADPDPPLIPLLDAMAVKAMFPTAAKIIANAKNTLQLVKDREHLDQLPRQLCTFEQTQLNLL